MRVAILGLPQSGRTMLWHILSSGHESKHDRMSTVKLPDERLERIATAANSKKLVYPEFEIVDTVGDVVKGGAIFSQLQRADALIIVVRGFDAGFGEPVPKVDAQKIANALRRFDASAIETRTKTLENDIKKGHNADERRTMEMELSTLRSFSETIESGADIRDDDMSDFAERVMRNQGLLTAKPRLIVLSTEGQPNEDELAQLEGIFSARAIWLATKLEQELRELEPDDAKAFRVELGIPDGMVERTLLSLRDAAGLVEFYTANEREARGWAIRKGSTALDAAAKVHTDMARGFIRAEVIPWNEFVESGGYAQAKKESRIRIVGKEYVVNDGDLIQFRFNV